MNEKAIRVAFGKNVRRCRTELELSQEQLSFNSKIHRTYIGAIERGERNITLLKIVQIAKSLHTTPSCLLEGVEAE